MKKSELIKKNIESIKKEIVSSYEYVLNHNGTVEVQIYMWDDGEIVNHEEVQGGNSYLVEGDNATRTLFYIYTVSEPFCDVFDLAGYPSTVPDNEKEREKAEKECISWLVSNYEENYLSDIMSDIIDEAEQEEKYRSEGLL